MQFYPLERDFAAEPLAEPIVRGSGPTTLCKTTTLGENAAELTLAEFDQWSLRMEYGGVPNHNDKRAIVWTGPSGSCIRKIESWIVGSEEVSGSPTLKPESWPTDGFRAVSTPENGLVGGYDKKGDYEAVRCTIQNP